MSPDTRRILLKRLFQVALGVALFVAAWHLTVTALHIPKYLVPVPLDVAKSFRTDWAVIASHVGFTLSAAASAPAWRSSPSCRSFPCSST